MQFPEFTKISINYARLKIEGVTIWYSYFSPIAFQQGDEPPVVRENWHERTNGKFRITERHINEVNDDAAARLSAGEFIRRFEAIQSESPVLPILPELLTALTHITASAEDISSDNHCCLFCEGRDDNGARGYIVHNKDCVFLDAAIAVSDANRNNRD